MLYNTIGNITCYITPLATSSKVDLNNLITWIFYIWYSMQRLTRSSCTNLGIDVGYLTQNMFFLCNTVYVTRYVTCYVICYVCTLCNMLCNMLHMLCNMSCNTAFEFDHQWDVFLRVCSCTCSKSGQHSLQWFEPWKWNCGTMDVGVVTIEWRQVPSLATHKC